MNKKNRIQRSSDTRKEDHESLPSSTENLSLKLDSIELLMKVFANYQLQRETHFLTISLFNRVLKAKKAEELFEGINNMTTNQKL
jgi:hypothetical protein